MVSKTREKLIDVARQLFAYKGVENTTMNDIAAASDKGRRTIYTYFKNKREIYNAVIEQQSCQIVNRLKAIVDDDSLSNSEKLRGYLTELFDIIAQSAPRPEGYRRLLLRDHRRVAKIFRLALDKERNLFNSLLAKGVESGDFNALQAERLPSIISSAIGSVYYYHADDNSGDSFDTQHRQLHQIIDFVVCGISADQRENQQNT